MENLNAENIKRGLECCANNDECVGEACPYYATGCENNMPKDALSLIKELTEENERLKNRITCQVVLPDEKLEEIKNECLERVELDIKAIQADTVTELVAGIKGILEFDIALTEEETGYIENRIDELVKEMVEGV